MPDGCRRITPLPSIGCSWPYRAKTALCLTLKTADRSYNHFR